MEERGEITEVLRGPVNRASWEVHHAIMASKSVALARIAVLATADHVDPIAFSDEMPNCIGERWYGDCDQDCSWLNAVGDCYTADKLPAGASECRQVFWCRPGNHP